MYIGKPEKQFLYQGGRDDYMVGKFVLCFRMVNNEHPYVHSVIFGAMGLKKELYVQGDVGGWKVRWDYMTCVEKSFQDFGDELLYFYTRGQETYGLWVVQHWLSELRVYIQTHLETSSPKKLEFRCAELGPEVEGS